jgi:exocyst complex component 1
MGKDADMAATMERLEEYKTHNGQFCKRLVDFLTVLFKFQAETTLVDKEKSEKGRLTGKGNQLPAIPDHSKMELHLGQYAGLLLYLKEMDEDRYSKICAVSTRFSQN